MVFVSGYIALPLKQYLALNSTLIHPNEWVFCTTAHTAAADVLFGEETTSQSIKKNIDTSPVSDKMKTLLAIAALVQKGGKHVTEDLVANARAEGTTDREIHDAVLIAASFCMFNRYVDGLATTAPQDRQFYINRAPQRALEGYVEFDLNK